MDQPRDDGEHREMTGCPGGARNWTARRRFSSSATGALTLTNRSTSAPSLETDGTAGGTTRLTNELCHDCSIPPGLVVVRGQAYFLGTNPAGPGFAVWVTDGTPAGTRALAPIGRPDSFYGENLEAAGVPGKVLFEAPDEMDFRQLWATDGTAAGTAPLTVLGSTEPSSSPIQITALAGHGVVFSAVDAPRGRCGPATVGGRHRALAATGSPIAAPDTRAAFRTAVSYTSPHREPAKAPAVAHRGPTVAPGRPASRRHCRRVVVYDGKVVLSSSTNRPRLSLEQRRHARRHAPTVDCQTSWRSGSSPPRQRLTSSPPVRHFGTGWRSDGIGGTRTLTPPTRARLWRARRASRVGVEGLLLARFGTRIPTLAHDGTAAAQRWYSATRPRPATSGSTT